MRDRSNNPLHHEQTHVMSLKFKFKGEKRLCLIIIFSYVFKQMRQCILTVRHILVECNHLARERKDIFGRRDVVESFRCHPTLIVLFLKQIEFYYKF